MTPTHHFLSGKYKAVYVWCRSLFVVSVIKRTYTTYTRPSPSPGSLRSLPRVPWAQSWNEFSDHYSWKQPAPPSVLYRPYTLYRVDWKWRTWKWNVICVNTAFFLLQFHALSPGREIAAEKNTVLTQIAFQWSVQRVLSLLFLNHNTLINCHKWLFI